MKPIIRVEELGKRYQIVEASASYQTLRESLAGAARAPLRWLGRNGGQAPAPPFWALKNINFEVAPGEVVGIVGRNGAGKSTLLKILSRITEPTTGRVELYGRIASLLEVGTGFHPELSGRENVFLNGAILGMRKTEIERKFDEIVAFSEVDKFIDTPVKRYSSGMYMRLAFAVAAHMEPEILLVDEVLSVGDSAFQTKCLSKMRDVANAGRTVIYISHNMVSVAALCQRVILLSHGELIEDGEPGKVIRDYVANYIRTAAVVSWSTPEDAPGSSSVRLKSVRVLNQGGELSADFHVDESLDIEITYWTLRPGLETNAGIHLYNSEGSLVFVSADFYDTRWAGVPKGEGVYQSVCRIPGSFLNEGWYTFNVAISLNATVGADVFAQDVGSFEIKDDGISKVRGKYAGQWTIGVMRPLLDWETTKMGEYKDGTDSQ